MSRLRIFLVSLFLIMFCISCKSKKVPDIVFEDLYGKWLVLELNGERVDDDSFGQFLEIDTYRKLLSGNAGCNRLFGEIEYNDVRKNVVKFSKVATTRKACYNDSERVLLEMLSKTVRFASDSRLGSADTIAFYSMNNAKLLVLKKQ